MLVSNILEALHEYSSNNNNVYFEFPEGKLEFNNHCDPNEIIIKHIILLKEYRRMGLFKALINEIIDSYPNIKIIKIYEPNITFRIILKTSIYNNRYFQDSDQLNMCWYRDDQVIDSNGHKYDFTKAQTDASELSYLRELLDVKLIDTFNRACTLDRFQKLL